jgi:hypothetical protein
MRSCDQDWKEFAWRLRVEHYEIFREVMEILRRQRVGETRRSRGRGPGLPRPPRRPPACDDERRGRRP